MNDFTLKNINIPESKPVTIKNNRSLIEILEMCLYYVMKYTAKSVVLLCKLSFIGLLYIWPAVYVWYYIVGHHNATDDFFFAFCCIWMFILYGATISVFVGCLYEYLNNKYGKNISN